MTKELDLIKERCYSSIKQLGDDLVKTRLELKNYSESYSEEERDGMRDRILVAGCSIWWIKFILTGKFSSLKAITFGNEDYINER